MSKIRFLFPIDGDVITPADGKADENGGVAINVRLLAPAGCELTVNEHKAIDSGRGSEGMCEYSVPITINGYRTALDAKCGAENEVIYIYRFKSADKKYRLALDDIIWSVRELAEKKDEYKSIFDCAFFRLFKNLNNDFGTDVHMNIYYTDENGFDLTMMPDKYKEEFIANNSWLKLTFHAYANEPSRIYRYSPYSVLIRDYNLVTDQIIRFAGKETMNTSANGLHYGETTVEGARALRECGINCLVGYYTFDSNGDPYVSYYLNKEQTLHCFDRDFWVDNKEGIIFSKDKMVIDAFALDAIRPRLDYLRDERPTEAGTMNFVTHEQYFYPYYCAYQPDYEKKIRTACAWAGENGYKPCFISDVIKEKYPD
ncbi:MAG: hypothetical protein VB118_05385 [Oscillospiraceae bacterium]|nr:hypothetical protein [Oscillospiraceae bacterium]